MKKKYDGAIEVTVGQGGHSLFAFRKEFKQPTKNDLIYFEQSPDYCQHDDAIGIVCPLLSRSYLMLNCRFFWNGRKRVQ